MSRTRKRPLGGGFIRGRVLPSIVAAAVLLVAAAHSIPAPGAANSSAPKAQQCNVTAQSARPFIQKVWRLIRWQRGAPKPSTVRAYKRKLHCAAGPGHRRAIANRWHRKRLRYGRHRHRMQYCRSGFVLVGRVSYFNGPSSVTASGRPVSEPGLALNIAPGTDSGWNNSTTRGWAASGQLFRVTIAGHTATMPVTDLGPSGFTGRAIDVTEAGVYKLGLHPSSFPTDSIGVARLLPKGCG